MRSLKSYSPFWPRLGRLLPASLAFVATVTGVGTAHAQTYKPRILLVFDTSGSMSFEVDGIGDVLGDNSREYPGNGSTSRLYVAKSVVTDFVETTSEVEFSLMRYPQQQGRGINDGVFRGGVNNYQGLQQNPLNYIGFCNGGALETGNPMDPFSVVVPFGDDNEVTLLGWLDGHENFPADPELRAEGPTPLVESLRLAASYYQGVLAADEGIVCRPNYVILFTDGEESCVVDDNDPGLSQRSLLERTVALRELDVLPAGGGPPIRKEVKTYVVAFALAPRAVNVLNTISRAGGTAVNPDGRLDLIGGRAYSADNQAGLRLAFSRILADAIPTEACDGDDDDCDGRVDEGVLNACGRCGGAPPEVCNDEDDDCDGVADEGVRNACGTCGVVPVEACNRRDDDCDGAVDEDVVNACGGCAAVAPEVCNGVDDDCDGRADNEPGSDGALARSCGDDLGECTRGEEICAAGEWSPCSGLAAVEELCNGLDDDCDGLPDEAARSCGAALDIGNVGVCRIGRQACVFVDCLAHPESCDPDGWSLTCDGESGPSDEVCNDLDDDCDNVVDEGLINACGRCGESLDEICNSEDDNCDGLIDERAACPAGHLCYSGECVVPCDSSGECAGGLSCVSAWSDGRYCHPDPCAGAICPPGTACSPETTACEDPCLNVDCAELEACDLGACVPETCRHTGCPEGERCHSDTCEPDPCAGLSCGEGQFCREGVCFAACRGVVCGVGRACLDGLCIDDACDGRCVRTQLCDDASGACVEDPCARIACARGLACVEGQCRADAPCATMSCPQSTYCVDGSCTDFTPGAPPQVSSRPEPDGGPTPQVDAFLPPPVDLGQGPLDRPLIPSSDDGQSAQPGEPSCSCRVNGGSAGSVWLALLVLALRRRRRV